MVGVTKVFTKANALFKEACELGDGGGCWKLGLNYEYGRGVTKDISKANSLYQKACKLGCKNSCTGQRNNKSEKQKPL